MTNRTDAPQIVGIINLTEDSFSDGGQFLEPKVAAAHARKLNADGANILELGPASSNPDARRVSAEEQIARIAPLLRDLKPGDHHLSVDATDPTVLAFAIDAGVGMLNDIRGFKDPSIHARLADSHASLVVVHSLLEHERAERSQATPSEVLASIDRFFDQRLTALIHAGISEERLIVDPGMGFFLGRDPNASLAVLQRIPELKARFGRPIFISVSRKSFLQNIAGRPVDQVQAATLAAELHAASAGAAFLRTHDVAGLRDALSVVNAIHTTVPTRE